MRKPHFIIIGAMKCGTTTLHDQLDAQRGIFMSTPKEPNFFSDDPIYQRGLNWYNALFSGAPPEALTGESSTHYTKRPTYPETPRRMAEHVPDARLVYVIRHPIDRLISHYIHEWTQRTVRGPVDRAIETFAPLVDYGCYAYQLRPFLETFGPQRIRIVSFARLKTDPQAVLEEVAAFIGCPHAVQWQDERARRNTSATRLRRSAWRDALVNAPAMTTLRRALVPRTVRDRIKSLWTMKERPRLTAARYAQLTQVFDRDLAELGQWLGLDLNCENFDTLTAAAPLQWTAGAPIPRSDSLTALPHA